jgi:hypothetical protein
MEARSCNYWCRGKAINITQLDCVFVAVCIQHAMSVRHFVTCGLPCSTLFFSKLPHKSTIFGGGAENYLTWNVCSDFLYKFCLKHLILKRNERDNLLNVHTSSCWRPINSCQILMKLEFSKHIFEKYSNVIKILTERAELFHWTDRQTDMIKLTVSFRSFGNSPKERMCRYIPHL